MNRSWLIGLFVLLLTALVAAQEPRGGGIISDGSMGELWVYNYVETFGLQPGDSFSETYWLNGTEKSFRVTLKEIVRPSQECFDRYKEWYDDEVFCWWWMGTVRLSIEATDGSNGTMWGPNGVEAELAREETFPVQDKTGKHLLGVESIGSDNAQIVFYKVAPENWQSVANKEKEPPRYGPKPTWMWLTHERTTMKDLENLPKKSATTTSSAPNANQETPAVSAQTPSQENKTAGDSKKTVVSQETKEKTAPGQASKQTNEKKQSGNNQNMSAPKPLLQRSEQAKQLLQTKEKIACENLSVAGAENGSRFECTAKQTGKLFGFIPIQFEIKATVDTEKEETRVEKPFWAFLVFR